MKTEKKLLLTFDYELFLGERSGKVWDCMIQPTEKILDLLSYYHCRAIFFIDTAFLLRLKDQMQNPTEAAKDFAAITEQLKKIHALGHDLFLHLHPHWMDAQYLYELNEWNLKNTSKYTLQALTDHEIDAEFSQGILSIQNALNDSDYTITGFRAGGLFIEPFQKLLPFFQKYRIKYDFSVLPKHKAQINAYNYDYFDFQEKEPYLFNTNTLQKESWGGFIEFPISTIEIPAWNRAIHFFKRRGRRNSELPKGQSAKISIQSKHGLWSATTSCSVESMNACNLSFYLRKLKEENFMHFLSHPKSVSTLNLKAFDQFLSCSERLYTLETDFRKMLPV